MASVNKVILIGKLGQDPSKSGTAVKFSLATNESWNDKQGIKQTRVEWSNVVCFGKLADICLKYLKKGSEVYVEGKLQTDMYEKDGVKKYSTNIIANTVQFLSKANNSNQDAAPGEYRFDSSVPEDAPF